MRTYGRLVLVIGLAIMIGAFFFPVVSDDESTRVLLAQAASGVSQTAAASLDLIALRTMLEIAGAATAVIGAIFAVSLKQSSD